MANDFVACQNRIADELARSDLTSQIKLAITTAVSFYQRERFYFNEARTATFATVLNQEFYTAADLAGIPNLIDIDTLRIAISSSYRYTLNKLTWQEIEDMSISSSMVGQPISWAYYNQAIRLYPIPNTAYTITVNAVSRLTPDPLTNDSDTNAWMTDGEELIRQRAKADLFCNVIRDPDAQAEARSFIGAGQNFLSALEKNAYTALRGETTQRLSSGHVTPATF